MDIDESVKAIAKATMTAHACLQCIALGLNIAMIFIGESTANMIAGATLIEAREKFVERVVRLNAAFLANDKESVARLILDAGMESGGVLNVNQDDFSEWMDILKKEADEIIKKRGGGS